MSNRFLRHRQANRSSKLKGLLLSALGRNTRFAGLEMLNGLYGTLRLVFRSQLWHFPPVAPLQG